MSKNQWITDSEKTIVGSPVVSFVELKCRSSEDDRKHTFYILKSQDWSNIIPVTREGKVVLVRQFRVGTSQQTLEIPGGTMDLDDSNAKDAAIREMVEETGYVPINGAQCESIGVTHPNPALFNNQVHCFIIGPVERKQEQKLDYGEMIETVEVDIQDIPRMIQDGEMQHALILNAFLLLSLKTESGQKAITDQLERFRSK